MQTEVSSERPHILLVEDSLTQALKLQHFLEQQQLTVTWVETAEQALKELQSKQPSLLITDLNLPGMNGDALCRELRMGINTRSLPILLLTSASGAQLEAQLIDSGADDYICKTDDDLTMLMQRVYALLRKASLPVITQNKRKRLSAAKVLIVEDSPTYREFLAELVTLAGFQVEIAGSGKSCFEHIAKDNYDVIVIDLFLPDIKGTQICQALADMRNKSDDPLSEFMIMALTGSQQKADLSAFLEAGADDVMVKSTATDVIVARIRSLLRRKVIYQENQKIQQENQQKEKLLMQERADKKFAQARAQLVDELERTNKELKETQAQLIQSAKMASLGQLVAGVAHEINNPTSFVMAHLQTSLRLMSEISDDLESRISERSTVKINKVFSRLNGAQQGIERVRDLILKLRSFSRLDEGEFKVSSMSENIQSVLTILQHKLGDRIKVRYQLSEHDELGFYPGLFNQALMNIIANSIDSITDKGVITIETEVIDTWYQISISDTGCGISESVKERIFEPFYTTKDVGDGMGLGMSITYKIIERHRGSIEIKSQEGQGSTIVIKLPIVA